MKNKHTYLKSYAICICLLFFSSCKTPTASKNKFNIVGKMKDVMWKGKLSASISLDTISNKDGLYGLGPQEFLKGELLINNGITYLSEVTSDSTLIVTQTTKGAAPFFVYSNVTQWETSILPKNIKTLKELEAYITNTTKEITTPFAFKVIGTVKEATIHVQNLPEGNTVSSPKEAHIGQVNYKVDDTDCTIIGVYSENHKGIFTHHDANSHMHLITNDKLKMGHLDSVTIDKMTLYLPK
ncbi:MAG: acetolactate decarboxylase [Polaribacter sp.]